MKKDLGDHIGKKRGWAWYELFELLKLAIKNPKVIRDIFKKKK
jgi:hypothetical protein